MWTPGCSYTYTSVSGLIAWSLNRFEWCFFKRPLRTRSAFFGNRTNIGQHFTKILYQSIWHCRTNKTYLNTFCCCYLDDIQYNSRTSSYQVYWCISAHSCCYYGIHQCLWNIKAKGWLQNAVISLVPRRPLHVHSTFGVNSWRHRTTRFHLLRPFRTHPNEFNISIQHSST